MPCARRLLPTISLQKLCIRARRQQQGDVFLIPTERAVPSSISAQHTAREEPSPLPVPEHVPAAVLDILPDLGQRGHRALRHGGHRARPQAARDCSTAPAPRASGASSARARLEVSSQGQDQPHGGFQVPVHDICKRQKVGGLRECGRAKRDEDL